MVPCFHVRSDPTNWVLQQKLRLIRASNVSPSLIQFWWGCVNRSFSFLFLADWQWQHVLSSAVACLLQGLIDLFRIPWFLKSCYWLDAHWSFSSGPWQRRITSIWHFHTEKWCSLIFSFFRTKSQQISSFWNSQIILCGTKQPCHV